MNIEETLDEAFKQLIKHEVSNDLLKSIKEAVSVSDINTLLDHVDSLGDPSEYCENDYDQKTPAGFFLYIDFISAVIIHLGDSALQEVMKCKDTNRPFVKWIVKYVEDERFHEEITAKFSEIFSQ